MPKRLDIINKIFNRLTVKEYLGKSKWKCECVCGNITEVVTCSLTSNKTKSCGCLNTEKFRKNSTKHGLRFTPEYEIWKAMRQRCNNPNNKRYSDYGGRGIKVCERWNKFENFIEDMGKRPEDKTSIDRKDNDGNYCKENCEWSTNKEQCNNKKTNIKINYLNKDFTIDELSKEINIDSQIIYNRFKLGWNIEKIISTPIEKREKYIYNRKITHKNKTMTLSEWSKELGIPKTTLESRMRKGWSDERIITQRYQKQHKNLIKELING